MTYSHIIAVPACPLCAGPHTFPYSPLYRITAAARRQPPTRRVRRFTLIVTCPTKNEAFQTTVELEEESDQPIERFAIGPAQ